MTFNSLILICLVISLSECGAYMGNNNKTTRPCVKGDTVELSCPEGHIIDVAWAIYKNDAGLGNNENQCGDPYAKEKVEDLCNGQQICQITCDDNRFDQSTCEKKKEKMRVQYDCIRDPCENYCCGNQGTCKITSTLQPTCECFENWSGTHCEVSPCENIPCINGACWVEAETMMTGKCFCNEGFSGPSCETYDLCIDVCRNGGTCTVNDLNEAECDCPSDFKGETCEIDCSMPCPSGFVSIPTFTAKCYKFSTTTVSSWQEALTECEAHGATLWAPFRNELSVFNSPEMDRSKEYWFGVSDLMTERSFITTSGTPWTWLNLNIANTDSKDCASWFYEVYEDEDIGWSAKLRDCSYPNLYYACAILNPCANGGAK